MNIVVMWFNFQLLYVLQVYSSVQGGNSHSAARETENSRRKN